MSLSSHRFSVIVTSLRKVIRDREWCLRMLVVVRRCHECGKRSMLECWDGGGAPVLVAARPAAIAIVRRAAERACAARPEPVSRPRASGPDIPCPKIRRQRYPPHPYYFKTVRDIAHANIDPPLSAWSPYLG